MRDEKEKEIRLYGMYCIVYTYTILVVATDHSLVL